MDIRVVTLFASCAALTASTDHSLTGKNFYIYTNRQTWNEAWLMCEADGRRLAYIENRATQEVLRVWEPQTMWQTYMDHKFWIGLHVPNATVTDFRWDHCEAHVPGSSFSNWKVGDPQNMNSDFCVIAERDTVEWRTDSCDSTSHQFLCEEDTGPCTYTYSTGKCTGAAMEIQVTAVNQTECEEACSLAIVSQTVCWMYSYGVLGCFLYLDTDPDACAATDGDASFTAGTRHCFKLMVTSSSSLVTNSNQEPDVDCGLYTTTQATTTAVATTTPPTTAVQSTTLTSTSETTETVSVEDCPCYQCVEVKDIDEIKAIVEALIRWMKVDTTTLSSTRRMRESEPDERPSAATIGYAGIAFLVTTVALFVVADITRLCMGPEKKIMIVKMEKPATDTSD